MEQKLAQNLNIPGVPGTITGPLDTTRFSSLGSIISELLKYLFPLAGFLLFIFIIFGGFQWLTSAGDPKKVEAARNRITYAVVGFVLLIAAFWITRIVNIILSPNQPFF